MESIAPPFAVEKVPIAVGQREYRPIVGVRADSPHYKGRHPNVMVLGYTLSQEERARIAKGDDIFLCLLTGGGPIQPHNLFVGAEVVSEQYGLPLES